MNIKTIAEHGVQEAELTVHEALGKVQGKLEAIWEHVESIPAHVAAGKIVAEAKALVESIKVHLGKDEKANDPEAGE